MVSTVHLRPPRTMMEVFESLPEGTSAQLIENNLVMSPAPLDVHQRIIVKIISKLDRFAELNHLGECRIAPYDVYLDQENVFQPDICFISSKKLNIIKAKGCFGAPDLVIEILSPSTAEYDLNDKKDVYERSGVSEYWIVDPKDASTHGYYLDHGKYVPFYEGKSKLEFRLLKLKIRF